MTRFATSKGSLRRLERHLPKLAELMLHKRRGVTAKELQLTLTCHTLHFRTCQGSDGFKMMEVLDGYVVDPCSRGTNN